MQTKNIVFYISLFIVAFMVSFGIYDPDNLYVISSYVHKNIIDHFGWGYLVSVFVFLVFSLWLAFSRYGRIKLGKDYEKPQYSYFGWLSMLFAAGMGIGLIFFGVAEPFSHYMNPPAYIQQASGEAARFSMQYSFFHWGLHPWAIYIIMSLAIAYFCFRRDMPFLISSCFYPLIGPRIYGITGYLIDILAVFATVFGIATSLGLGAMQINSGLSEAFGIPDTMQMTLVIIATVTVLFMISSISGLDKGIQILSKTNIIVAIILMMLMLAIGPTSYILNIFTSTVGNYFSSLLDMSLNTHPFEGYRWTKEWTLFYWATWIAWSPFVGLFIASISRGRTIKEFILVTLFVPTVLTFAWFSVFGGSALHLELFQGVEIAGKAVENVSTALFRVFEHYPLSMPLTITAVVLLAVFFITSADSATYVLAMMTSRGDLNPPMSRKLLWGILQSATASILLLSGGVEALKKMVIAAALPFTIVMLFLCVAILRGLRYEVKYESDESPGETQ
ncbi:MAG: glycine betaine uptake BCCT transporter [Spirochaetota bacterium]